MNVPAPQKALGSVSPHISGVNTISTSPDVDGVVWGEWNPHMGGVFGLSSHFQIDNGSHHGKNILFPIILLGTFLIALV